MTDYGMIFTIGFLSSFGHCIGMCGGFVTAYTMKLNADKDDNRGGVLQKISPHIFYNTGRILTYIFLGALFGLLGETLHLIAGMRHYQGILQAVAGLFMILIALDMGGWIPATWTSNFPGYRQFKIIVGGLFSRVHKGNIIGLGVAMGFLPCGLVYAAGAKAASTGSIVSGMLTMLFFGLGTFPALFAVGLSANAISANFRSKIFKFATVLVILFGIFTTYKGIHNFAGNHAAAQTNTTTGHVH